MGQPIKRFQDGSFLEYDQGSFDSWCVYYTDALWFRTAPKDTDYLSQLCWLAARYGAGRVYGDYVRVYEMVGGEASGDDLEKISRLAGSYGRDALRADIVFSTLYLAMIAEERRANTRLGKRIKRLAVHQILKEEMSVSAAANYTRGMGWRDIARLCEERGF